MTRIDSFKSKIPQEPPKMPSYDGLFEALALDTAESLLVAENMFARLAKQSLSNYLSAYSTKRVLKLSEIPPTATVHVVEHRVIQPKNFPDSGPIQSLGLRVGRSLTEGLHYMGIEIVLIDALDASVADAQLLKPSWSFRVKQRWSYACAA